MKTNRTILGLFCVLLAIGVAFGAAPIINKTAAAKTDIVRVTRNISQGSKITDDDVQIVNVGAHGLPESVIKNTDAVIGKYAAVDLRTDDYLLPSKLGDTADSADYVFKTLDGSRQAMSISIGSFANGVSGKLQNGDIVSVIAVNKTTGAEATIPPQLKYVRVITATSSTGYDADNPNEEASEMPSTVTLLVNEEQSKLLAEYEANGIVHLALVFRGEEETANQFIAVQDQFFETANTEEEGGTVKTQEGGDTDNG